MDQHASLRERYRLANQYRELAFVDRPFLGSPGAPAQAETNVSGLWAHLNGGFLMGYEYTHWWEESLALRQAAVLGDWSWLNKVRVTGPDATAFMDWISVKSMAKRQVGQTIFTPMVSEHGRIAIEGLTLKLGENDYLFTQSGAQFWLAEVAKHTPMRVELEDVTPDWTCFALQGPRSRDVLEAVTGESFADLGFSRWRRLEIFGTDLIVQRQGVTGELGYELLMRTGTGRAHELWRATREAGAEFGLRELGFKAQLIGHTESNMPTVIRDFLPDRFPREKLPRFARLWSTEADLAALDHDLTEHLATPAELGWGHTVDLDHEFLGRSALVAEAEAGGTESAEVLDDGIAHGAQLLACPAIQAEARRRGDNTMVLVSPALAPRAAPTHRSACSCSSTADTAVPPDEIAHAPRLHRDRTLARRVEPGCCGRARNVREKQFPPVRCAARMRGRSSE
jgi:Glycine cleavage system T protein (aminomethyltransferase)